MRARIARDQISDTTPAALARGFWHAHMGWIFERDLTNQRRFAPDLLADRDIRIVHRLFGLSWIDFFRSPIFWHNIERGLIVQACYLVVFLGAAWANMSSKDITS